MSGIINLLWSYLDWTTVLVGVATYFVVKFISFKGYLSKKNLPPGLYGMPIFGTLPQFAFTKKTTFEVMSEHYKKYGPFLRYSEKNWVVSGTHAVRELFGNDELLGRPQNQNEELEKLAGKGIGNIEGELWKKHRRFSLYTLRDLGFGKTARMEEYLQEELKEIIEIIDKAKGEPFDCRDYLVSSTSNNIATLLFGERLPFDHPKRKKFNYTLTAFTDKTEQFVAIALIPGLLKIMTKLNIGVMKTFKDVINDLKEIINQDIQQHLKQLDKENPKDYIDHYLIQSEKDKDFTMELAFGNSSGFFQAGSATVRIALEYLIHFMASRPDIQEKVFDEINRVVGVNREVTWADAKDLPYTNAVITERHRYFTIAPLGVQRRALRDTKLCGYDVPAGTTISYNLDSVHFDEEIFPDPYEFKPERFLDGNGNLCNTEKVWAFALGKRACPGESFAVLEVFLYFANIVQRFRLLPEKDGVEVKLRPPRSLIADVIQQKIRYVPRS